MRASNYANVVLFILVLVISSGTAQDNTSGPQDVFNGVSPSFSTKAPEAVKFNVGDWGVSEQRGAATYTYSIDVPPGRNGMQPSLALRYSSQSPLRGGIAVGWTLDGLPSIQIDRSLGQEDHTIYKASLGSATGRLIEVPDKLPYPGKAYRVDYDASFTRFIHIEREEFEPGVRGWIALTSDGVQHFFEESELPTTFYESRWHITKQVDRFENTVSYYWMPVKAEYADGTGIRTIDLGLDRIEYTSNEAAGLSAHAKVMFKYAPLETAPGSRIPIGAEFFHNRGAPVNGYYKSALRLTAIETYVRDELGAEWRLSKRLSLGYDTDALIDITNGAPLRYLTRIDVSARDIEGNETIMPPITFEYGRKVLKMDSVKVIESPGYGHYGTYLGAVGTLLDLDGDGIRDRVSVIEKNGLCTLVWQKGRFGGAFAEEENEWLLPTTTWGGVVTPNGAERCNLNGQVVNRSYKGGVTKGIVSFHFMDYDADGRVDLLTNIWTSGQHDAFLPQTGNQTGTLRMAIDPYGPATYIDPLGQVFTHDPGSHIGPKPVVAPLKPEKASSDKRKYIWHLYRNTGSGFDLRSPGGIEVFSPPVHRKEFPPSLPPSASDEDLDESLLSNTNIPTLFDLDADGYLDFIDIGGHPALVNPDSGKWDVYFGKETSVSANGINGQFLI